MISKIASMEIFHAREVFCYVLEGSSAGVTGQFAETWKLERPSSVCRLILVETNDTPDGTQVMLVFIDKEQENADESEKMPIYMAHFNLERPREYYMEQCKDTSRYFVLKFAVMCPKNTRKRLGFGFRERGQRFDFLAAIDDCYKRFNRARSIEQEPADAWKNEQEEKVEKDEKRDAATVPTNTELDLQLKAPRIKLHLPLLDDQTDQEDVHTQPVKSSASELFKLPPPPPPPSELSPTHERISTTNTTPIDGATDNAEEWGDFTHA